MNRLGFLILSVLSRNEATNKASAMTAKEITEAENLGCRQNTVFKKVTEFELSGYVASGFKEGRAKTFFITDKGMEFLRNV